MKTIYILLTLISLFPLSLLADLCPNDFLNELKKEKADVLVCEVNKKLINERAAFVIRFFEMEQGENSGITVSIHKAEVKDGKTTVDIKPLFLDSGMGSNLLPFFYNGKKFTHLIADINGDGVDEWIINAFNPPQTGILLIKYLDKESKRFETIMPFINKNGQKLPENMFFVTHHSLPPRIEKNKIFYKVPKYPIEPGKPYKFTTQTYMLELNMFVKK